MTAVLNRRCSCSAAGAGLSDLIGFDIETRSVNGTITRGVLLAVGDRFLVIERSTNRRRAFISVAHLVCLVDETPPALSKRERTELAGEAEDGGA